MLALKLSPYLLEIPNGVHIMGRQLLTCAIRSNGAYCSVSVFSLSEIEDFILLYLMLM